jgi:ergothioneine biosynthesis protein EgtB
VLGPLGDLYCEEDERLDYLLNSYYVALGPRIARNRRGLVTRPRTDEIYEYRASVDRRMEKLIERVEASRLAELDFLLRIGLNHEQQHQELFYTEIKYILAQDPPLVREPYRVGAAASTPAQSAVPADEWRPFQGGLLEFGHLEDGWAWDNEQPIHKYYLQDFAIASRLVTCGQFEQFIDDGGYRQPLLWLDNGWRTAAEQAWESPLYWEKVDGQWQLWTLGGMRKLDPREPVCHVSFYEADAFARWAGATDHQLQGARLPSEREWEHAARSDGLKPCDGHFLDSGRLHPAAARGQDCLEQMLGDVWEWTASYYEPYPGYRPFPGALAEYNGKFMDNQRVLRGGSCVSERDHIRISYRNFWAPATRFQFSGIRLARDL